MSWYSASLGSHDFEVAPSIEPAVERVVRPNVSPNVAVAANYRIALTCRVRRDADDTAAEKLGLFLAACVHTSTCPALTISDSEDDPIPEWGQIGEDAEDADEVNLGWEDVRLVSFSLPAVDGQLVAGATFALVIEARRSFPDSDGVCELEQVLDVSEDDGGNEVRRLTSRVRLAKASGATVETAAVAARLRLAAPVGTVRVDSYREPLYPLRHLAEYTSEVRATSGVTGASGATSATSTQRVIEVPEKGIRRLVDTSETAGGEDPLGWVQGQAPSADLVGASTSLDEGTVRSARGEWRRVEALGSAEGKTVRALRTFDLDGGEREVGAVLMAPPIRPKIQVGPWAPFTLTETVQVYTLAGHSLDDYDLPEQLGAPWVLSRRSHALPRVDEDAMAPGQRLWVWTFSRTYWWDSEDHPLTHPGLIAALFESKDVAL